MVFGIIAWTTAGVIPFVYPNAKYNAIGNPFVTQRKLDVLIEASSIKDMVNMVESKDLQLKDAGSPEMIERRLERSHTTVLSGLEKDMPKSVKLATLSTLGRPKSYDVYIRGELSHTELTEANNELMDVYNDIRQSTYRIMQEIADALGDDFFCWRTDCIYFKNTKKNCKTVIDIVEEHNIGWKYELKED